MDPRSRQLAAEPSGLNEGIEPSPQDLDLCSTSELVRSQAHLAPAACWTRRGPGRAVRYEETTASDGHGNTLAGTWAQRAPARSWEPGDSPVTPLDSAEVERRDAAWSLTWRKAQVSRLPLRMLEWAGRCSIHGSHQCRAPLYLGGASNGQTYRLPTAYRKAVTQQFRRAWPYGQGRRPTPQELQKILLEVYSEYPIPQLIGITP